MCVCARARACVCVCVSGTMCGCVVVLCEREGERGGREIDRFRCYRKLTQRQLLGCSVIQ